MSKKLKRDTSKIIDRTSKITRQQRDNSLYLAQSLKLHRTAKLIFDSQISAMSLLCLLVMQYMHRQKLSTVKALLFNAPSLSLVFPLYIVIHGHRITACTVVQAVVLDMGQVNGRERYSTLHSSEPPRPIFMKLEIYNYFRTRPRMQNFRGLRRRGWSGQIASLTQESFCPFFVSSPRPQVAFLDTSQRSMSHYTSFPPRKCLLGVRKIKFKI